MTETEQLNREIEELTKFIATQNEHIAKLEKALEETENMRQLRAWAIDRSVMLNQKEAVSSAKIIEIAEKFVAYADGGKNEG